MLTAEEIRPKLTELLVRIADTPPEVSGLDGVGKIAVDEKIVLFVSDPEAPAVKELLAQAKQSGREVLVHPVPGDLPLKFGLSAPEAEEP